MNGLTPSVCVRGRLSDSVVGLNRRRRRPREWGLVLRGTARALTGSNGRCGRECCSSGSRGFAASRRVPFVRGRADYCTDRGSLSGGSPLRPTAPVTVLSPRRVLTVIARASAGDRVDWCNTRTQRREERQTTFAEFHGPLSKAGLTERLLCLAAQWKDTETLIVLSTATHQVAQGPEGRRRTRSYPGAMACDDADGLYYKDVDLDEQRWSSCVFERPSKKWQRQLFWCLLKTI